MEFGILRSFDDLIRCASTDVGIPNSCAVKGLKPPFLLHVRFVPYIIVLPVNT